MDKIILEDEIFQNNEGYWLIYGIDDAFKQIGPKKVRVTIEVME